MTVESMFSMNSAVARMRGVIRDKFNLPDWGPARSA